ncbi:MAG: dihydroorotate dehydrogenase (quinone), partial [Proteobacteria bacterium]
GIMSVADAQQRFDCGADLIQIYSGLIYHGPQLIKDINHWLTQTHGSTA